MDTALTINLNGQQRTLSELSSPSDLRAVIAALELKSDRIAVEHNGKIIRRDDWQTTMVAHEDQVEVVHFVGGGT